MSSKSFPAVVLTSVIAAAAFPLAAMAQSEPMAAGSTEAAAQEQAAAAPEMQSVLDKLAELGAKPLHTLTVDEAPMRSSRPHCST